MPDTATIPALFPGLFAQHEVFTARLHAPTATLDEHERCHFCSRDSIDVSEHYAVVEREGREVGPICMVCLARTPAWWRQALHAMTVKALNEAKERLPDADQLDDGEMRLEVESAAVEATLAGDFAAMLAYGIGIEPALAEVLAREGITAGDGCA